MKKILVIEDEDLLRVNTVQILQFEDFSTLAAENGWVGIQLAQEHLPDLILCDVMMPELDGYGVLATLRQNPLTATIPFIFTTAKSTKADLRRGMELGADDYLTKPFNADELLNAISTRLEKQAIISQRHTAALKQAEEKLNYLIQYDSLTNLPNQLLLQECLSPLLDKANCDEKIVALFIVNLEHLQQINNTLGHFIGDLLLKEVAERLITCLGEDIAVFRLQAKQFAISLPSIKQEQEAVNVAQTVLNTLSFPFLLEGYEVFITTSIGIALYPFDGTNITTLIKNANIAMYFAKEQTSNNYQFYNKNIDLDFSRQLLLNSKLHHALERAEFQVYYQPQVDLKTGKIVGAEALLRWHHPELGFISPAEFIPIAEENGLIIPISEWVLMTACQQNKSWHMAGFPLRISVNLSGRHFNQHNFSQDLVRRLAETGLEPEYLELELTESILIRNLETVNQILNELRSLKIQIAIDDFGTGYSSLSYLKRFSFDTLKIDRCFVNGSIDDLKTRAIVTAIIQMAHDLSLKVIAEGVETEAELSFVWQQNCDEIQGYFFSRPLPAVEFERLLTTGKNLHLPHPNRD
jgi:diguanylate cyclase (GGDEF)-like protein